jgi:hypothetical protein
MTPSQVAEKVIGMPFNGLYGAAVFIESHDLKWRITCVDGIYRVVTRDFVPTRINLKIVRDIITEASVG